MLTGPILAKRSTISASSVRRSSAEPSTGRRVLEQRFQRPAPLPFQPLSDALRPVADLLTLQFKPVTRIGRVALPLSGSSEPAVRPPRRTRTPPAAPRRACSARSWPPRAPRRGAPAVRRPADCPAVRSPAPRPASSPRGRAPPSPSLPARRPGTRPDTRPRRRSTSLSSRAERIAASDSASRACSHSASTAASAFRRSSTRTATSLSSRASRAPSASASRSRAAAFSRAAFVPAKWRASSSWAASQPPVSVRVGCGLGIGGAGLVPSLKEALRSRVGFPTRSGRGPSSRAVRDDLASPSSRNAASRSALDGFDPRSALQGASGGLCGHQVDGAQGIGPAPCGEDRAAQSRRRRPRPPAAPGPRGAPLPSGRHTGGKPPSGLGRGVQRQQRQGGLGHGSGAVPRLQPFNGAAVAHHQRGAEAAQRVVHDAGVGTGDPHEVGQCARDQVGKRLSGGRHQRLGPFSGFHPRRRAASSASSAERPASASRSRSRTRRSSSRNSSCAAGSRRSRERPGPPSPTPRSFGT